MPVSGLALQAFRSAGGWALAASDLTQHAYHTDLQYILAAGNSSESCMTGQACLRPAIKQHEGCGLAHFGHQLYLAIVHLDLQVSNSSVPYF